MPHRTGKLIPQLATTFREGYAGRDLKADAVAGLTVAIVALPLSMAIAIGSGVSPERGLYTSIIGGALVSMLGGSRFQIGGPAGAFIVLVGVAVDRLGLDGLMLAVALSGLMLLAAGILRLGTLVRHIPYAVTIGFTAGIGIIIAAGQLRDLLGLHLPGKEPGPLVPKLLALGQALPTAEPSSILLAALGIGTIVLVRRWRPTWPAFLIAVVLASVVAAVARLPVATIGTTFGALPRMLPPPHAPLAPMARVIEVLPTAFSFALLGGIESLLSAVVADRLSGGRHRPNVELVAQGLANLASSVFGGICVTGTIARTATNVRAGAHSPVSGILHAAFVLAIMASLAPLAGYIPLAVLAAVLVVVCWSMIERHAIVAVLRGPPGEIAVLAVTVLLVVFRDLTTGIVAGTALAALLPLRSRLLTYRR